MNRLRDRGRVPDQCPKCGGASLEFDPHLDRPHCLRVKCLWTGEKPATMLERMVAAEDAIERLEEGTRE